MKFDDLIVKYLGEFGTYQKILFFLVCLPTIFTAIHSLSWAFSAAKVPYRCRLPNEPADAFYNIEGDQEKLSKFKRQEACLDSSKFCPYEKCKLATNETCTSYIFDKSEINMTATEEWNLTCQNEYIIAIVQTMYYIGQMFGSILFGHFGDQIGRKKVFFIAIVMQIIGGIMMSVFFHWINFAIFRFVLGFAHPGIFVIAVVIGVELVGPSKRKCASVVPTIFFSLGQMLLGVTAYFVRDFHDLQKIIAIPPIIFLFYWWIIPESARWLISQKRFKEADVLFQRIARINKTKLPPKWWEEIDEPFKNSNAKKLDLDKEKNNVQKVNLLDLFKTPKLRKISLSIFFCWPVVSMIYYGLSMDPTIFGGDRYISFLIGSLSEIPASFLVYFLIDRIGRKPLLISGFLTLSICVLSYFYDFKNSFAFIKIIQYFVSKCSITITYASIYTYTPELFPTVIRNSAMGLCSMIARFGGISSSFLIFCIEDKRLIFFLFSLFGTLSAIILFFLLPETKGCNLIETIDELESNVLPQEVQPLKSNESSNLTKNEFEEKNI